MRTDQPAGLTGEIQSCGNCRYWEPLDITVTDKGTCMRYPRTEPKDIDNWSGEWSPDDTISEVIAETNLAAMNDLMITQAAEREKRAELEKQSLLKTVTLGMSPE